MSKEGKQPQPKRTADDMWHELTDIKKHIRLDQSACLDYLRQIVDHRKRPVVSWPAHGQGRVVIAAPSMEALLEVACKLQDPKAYPMPTRSKRL